MKPYYILTIMAMFCFSLLGLTAAFLFSDGGEEGKREEKKTTEELAAELDKALGVERREDNQIETESSSLEGRQEADLKKEKKASKNDPSFSGSRDVVTEKKPQSFSSRAIFLASDKGTISVDKLLEIVNE